jgi:nucleoside-diphosphate-sugar epimerase
VFGPSDNHVQTAKDNVQGTEDLVTAMASFLPNIICRLVLTSSMAAVRGTGQEPLNGKYYTYKDWNTQSKILDVDHDDHDQKNWGVSYQWSKAESERRAWELAKQHGLPMTSICPSFVFGPPSGGGAILSNSYSITLVGQWVRGESSVQSRLCVDIRDVAQAHVAAGTRKEAIGQRFLVSSEARKSSRDMAQALEQVCRDTGLGDASRITFDADFKGGAIPIGAQEVEAIERLRKSLGVHLRPVEETIADMGRALLMAGVKSSSSEEVPESTK